MRVSGWQRQIFSALAFRPLCSWRPPLSPHPRMRPPQRRVLPGALAQYRPYVLSILRIMVGPPLPLQHGMAKMFNFPPQGDMPVYPAPEWFAGGIELVGSTFIALGLLRAR